MHQRPFEFSSNREIADAREWVTKNLLAPIRKEFRDNGDSYTDLDPFSDKAVSRWLSMGRYTGPDGPREKYASRIHFVSFQEATPDEVKDWWNELGLWIEEYDVQWKAFRGSAKGGVPLLTKWTWGAWLSKQYRTDLGLDETVTGLTVQFTLLEADEKFSKHGSKHEYIRKKKGKGD